MSKRDEERLREVNLLELTPVRLATWEGSDERVVVIRPRPTRRSLMHVVEWLLYFMSARRIRLDAIGGYLWRQMDGHRTVSQLAADLRAHFGEQVEPTPPGGSVAPGTSVEERLGEVIPVLRRERLIGYVGWDDDAIEADRR